MGGASVGSYQLKNGKRLWRVRWRVGSREHTKRGFARKGDADRYAANITKTLFDGTYIDPATGHITVGFLANDWLSNKKAVVKTKYFDTLEGAWRNHVAPVWANREIGGIRKSEVQRWISDMVGVKRERQYAKDTTGYSVSVITRNYTILKGILDMAVEDGLIVRNPCQNVAMPKRPITERVYLTPEQLIRLANHSGRYRTLVLVLGTCGLRWGEAAGLKVKNVDFKNRRLHIVETWERSGNKRYSSSTKNHERRDVPVCDLTLDALRDQCKGKHPNDLVFTDSDGEHIREQIASVHAKRSDSFQWLGNAIVDSGVPKLTCHDLRHTAASIAVSSGANVKALQRMLGHKSAKQTLDRYAGLFDMDLNQVAINVGRVMDAASRHSDTVTTP